MALLSRRRKALRCSFCGRDEHSVSKLVAGPKVHICNNCVELCSEILAAESGTPGKWQSLDDEELLGTLEPTEQCVGGLQELLARRVDLLRERAVTWGRIGEALGISRQAAWERFS